MFKITKSYIQSKFKTSIILISDIHYTNRKDIKKLDKLYNVLKNMKSKYVCIAGDLIDSYDIEKKYIINYLKKLSKIKKVIISLGNHDIRSKDKEYTSFFDKDFWNTIKSLDNVYLLNNEGVLIDDIYFYGFTQSFNYYYKNKCESLDLLLNEIDNNNVNKTYGKYKVLLMHSPIFIDNKIVREKLSSYDLILSGHMHNGCIPPIIDELVKNNRGIIAPNKKIFPKNARGISIVGNYAVVSSGITKLSRSAPLILRMFNFIFPMSIHELIIGSDDVYKNNIKYLK